jgi:hypothetical protein
MQGGVSYCGDKSTATRAWLRTHRQARSRKDRLGDALQREDFIDRARNPRINSRLGCQCILENGSGAITVTVPDQSLLHGE